MRGVARGWAREGCVIREGGARGWYERGALLGVVWLERGVSLGRVGLGVV